MRYFVIGRSAQALLSVGFLMLAVRVLPPAEFGTYMVILGLASIGRNLSSQGLVPTVQQFLPEMALHATRQQLQAFVRWVWVLRLGALAVFAIVLFWGWSPISHHLLGLDAGAAPSALAPCLFVVVFLSYAFTGDMLTSLLEQKSLQVIRALYPLGRILGLGLLVSLDVAGLVAMLWVDIAIAAICLLLSEVALLRKLRVLQPDGSRSFTVREIAVFGWHLSGASLLGLAADGGTLRLIVASQLGIVAAGHFAFFHQLLQHLSKSLPSVLFAGLLRPMLIVARLENQFDRMNDAARWLWKSNALVVWPIVGAALVFSDEIARRLSGGRIAETGLALGFMALAASSTAQGHVSTLMLQVCRHSAAVRAASVASLALPLLLAAGTLFSLAGACLAVAAGTMLRTLVSWKLLQRREPVFRQDFSGAARCAVAVLLTCLVMWLAGPPLHVALAVGASVYLLLLPLLKPLDQRDLGLLKLAGGRRSYGGLETFVALFVRRKPA